MPGVLKSFVKLHPKIHPTLRTGYPDAIKAMVLNGEVDVAVTTIAPSHPEIVEESIASEEIVAIVSAKHPLASKKRLTETELETVSLVLCAVMLMLAGDAAICTGEAGGPAKEICRFWLYPLLRKTCRLLFVPGVTPLQQMVPEMDPKAFRRVVPKIAGIWLEMLTAPW